MFEHRKHRWWNQLFPQPNSNREIPAHLGKGKKSEGVLCWKIVVRVSDWTGNDSLDNKSCFGSRMMKWRKMATLLHIAQLTRFLRIMRTLLKEHPIIMRYPFLIMRRNTRKLTRFTLTKSRRKSINELTCSALNFFAKINNCSKKTDLKGNN